MGKILALDYGEKTVGVALSDALRVIASPAETITREKENHLRRTLAAIQRLVEEESCDEIVLGYPVHLDGTESPMTEKVRAFRDALQKRVSVPVILFDERLTTVEADEVLSECGIPKKDRKKVIDSVSAAVLLRDYMNGRGEKENGADRVSDG